jgi:hypothetical protein
MNFEFKLRGNPSEELPRIKSEAAKQNITFIGDSREGSFAGGTAMLDLAIKGIYGVAGNKLMITVYDKPSTQSWDHVRTMLKNFIEQ